MQEKIYRQIAQRQTPGQLLHKIKQLDIMRTLTGLWIATMVTLQLPPMYVMWLNDLMSWWHRDVTMTSVVISGIIVGGVFMYRWLKCVLVNYVRWDKGERRKDDYWVEVGVLPLAQGINSIFSLMFWTGLSRELTTMPILAAITVGWIIFNGCDWTIDLLQWVLNKKIKANQHRHGAKG